MGGTILFNDSRPFRNYNGNASINNGSTLIGNCGIDDMIVLCRFQLWSNLVSCEDLDVLEL